MNCHAAICSSPTVTRYLPILLRVTPVFPVKLNASLSAGIIFCAYSLLLAILSFSSGTEVEILVFSFVVLFLNSATEVSEICLISSILWLLFVIVALCCSISFLSASLATLLFSAFLSEELLISLFNSSPDLPVNFSNLAFACSFSFSSFTISSSRLSCSSW